jgi:hypothetical protein
MGPQKAAEPPAAGQIPGEPLIPCRAPQEAAQSIFERLESPATEDIEVLLEPTPRPILRVRLCRFLDKLTPTEKKNALSDWGS